MRIVFFGTPNYVVPVLEGLHKFFRTNANPRPVVAVITQAPKPSGRNQKMSYSPVDDWAYQRKIPKYFNPQDILKEKIQADIGVLASYGEIIPNNVINYFKFGILNIHPSLLPSFRGASPIPASIISGNANTGVSIIKLDSKLDHGSIICQFKDELTENETSETLRKRLFERSAEVMPKLIEAYIAGKITPKKQDDEKATFTRQLKKDDALIDPKLINVILKGKQSKDKMVIPFMKDFSISCSPDNLYNFIRAMYPWPIAWTFVKTTNEKGAEPKRLKLISAHMEKERLVIDRVQLEGKSEVSWKQFTEGYPNASFS